MDEYMHKAQRSIGGGSRGSKHQLLIDQSAEDARSRRTNLAISWIDYKKAYDSVPHSWILECLRLYKIDPRLVTFIKQSMSHWRTTLSANSKSIADVTIKCGIYQGDALPPLLFCIALNPLSALLVKSTYGYRFKSGTTRVRRVLMSKLSSKNKVTAINTFAVPVIRYPAGDKRT